MSLRRVCKVPFLMLLRICGSFAIWEACGFVGGTPVACGQHARCGASGLRCLAENLRLLGFADFFDA